MKNLIRRVLVNLAFALRPEVKLDGNALSLMLAVAANPTLYRLVRNAGVTLGDLNDTHAVTLFVALEEAFRSGDDFAGLMERLVDPVLREEATRRVLSGEFAVNPERLVVDGVKRLQRDSLSAALTDALGSARQLEGTLALVSRTTPLGCSS